jgi:glycosyltransferase involved in cell wall biosynthesis
MKRIIFILPTNFKGGPQKLAANLAYSFNQSGWESYISYPLFPYFHLHFKQKRYKIVFGLWKSEFLRFIQNPRFSFHEITDNTGIKIANFLFRPNKKFLNTFDKIVIFTEYSTQDLDETLEKKTVLYLMHPTELTNEAKISRSVFQDFNGKIITISQFTSNWLNANIHIDVKNCICPLSPFFKTVPYIPINERPFDFLINYIPTFNKGIDLSQKFIHCIEKIAPELMIGLLVSFEDIKKVKKIFPKCMVYSNIPENQLPGLYSKFKFFFFPSRFEGFGIPPLESLACSTIPILMKDVGSNSLYTVDGKNAIYLCEDN